jgi:ribonuclease Z
VGKIIILGSAYAVASEGAENTHLFIQQNQHGVLVDCGSSPIVRLKRAGIQIEEITDLILTHFHPDHVSGVPLLLMDMWLLGRKNPLHIYGLDYTIRRTESMLKLFDWKSWPGFYPVQFHTLPDAERSPVMEESDLRIYASPSCHMIPSIGLRVEFLPQGKTVVYSSDTEPCQSIMRLGMDADVLIHEATGEEKGHSSAEQAAGVAEQANVSQLYMIHYPSDIYVQARMLEEAGSIFHGKTELARDFMVIEF